MAGDLDKTKQVFFIGAWRAQQVTDQLLRQISNQIGSKKKVVTKLSISAEGLELLILNSNGQATRKDKIALENIVDFIDNKYSTTCTLAIVRDKQRRLYTVFVFQCRSDRDAAALIYNFKTTKRQLSGEGYNTNLTPKGKNWTLQQKSEQAGHQALNGDVKRRTLIANPSADVRVINTEKQNGGVTVINTTERHDSISRESVKTANSEVKEELHQLAGEVRDIKRMLQVQGSKGRAQFEQHYGYRIRGTAVPEVQRQEQQYIERNVSIRPVEVRRENIYVKNEANARYVETVPQVVRAGGAARSTRRYKTRGHFVTATSPTRADYTKRVYDSTNPFSEGGQRIQPVRVIAHNTQPILVPRSRLYPSQSSDIVHKNIEDVYRSRSLRKIYLPPSPNGKTADYVNNQMIQRAPQVPSNSSVTKETEQNTVHVKYSPEVRTYYETTKDDATGDSDLPNVSTNVYTSVNDNLDDKLGQIESSLDVQQNESFIKKNENEIVVKTVTEYPQSSTKDMSKHVVYVENDNVVQRSAPDVISGNVYHVRAEFADDYEKQMVKDENLTVIETDKYEVKSENIGIVENGDNLQTAERVVSFDDNLPAQNDDQENVGLFGAYVQKPEEHDEPRDEVTVETAYRYHEDEIEIEESNAQELHSEREDVDTLGAYANKTDEYEESQNGLTAEASYRYHDGEKDIEESKSEELRSERDDGGLFGAYVKTPEEYDEPQHDVTKETSYRYHEDEIEIKENKTDELRSEREDVGLIGATKTEEYDELRNEVVEGSGYKYHENYTIENVGDQSELLDIQETPDSIEEKRVRYNETVEQIPLVDNEAEYRTENVHIEDVYTAETQQGDNENGFQNELSAVVSKLRHNYDEKIKEDTGHNVNEKEDDENYEFDMNALKAYSAEPDIIIVDANNENIAKTVTNKLPVPEKESLNVDIVEKTITEKRDSLEKSKAAVMEELRNGTDKLVSKKDEILEFTSKTEDTVLF